MVEYRRMRREAESMRRLTRLQRILILIILFLVLFGCIMLGMRQNTISNLGYSAWSYIKYGLVDKPLSTAGNAISDVANLWHVYDDNVYLNEQLAEQRAYQTLYEDERNKNLELQKLLDMKNTLGEAVQVSCEVISRPTQAWNQTVTLSAGSAQGIEEGMLAASGQGAVGLVENVQDSTCVVRLLTSNELKNDVGIQIALEDGSAVEGVLRSYNAEKNCYECVIYDDQAKISSGQLVATSGKGGNYPDGIQIGAVDSMEVRDDAIVSTIYVTPVSNISDFNYCLVMGKGSVNP